MQTLGSSGCKLEEAVAAINPPRMDKLYGQFNKTKPDNFMQLINVKLARWTRRKQKGFERVTGKQ